MSKKDFKNIDGGLKEFLDYLNGQKDKGVTVRKLRVKTTKKTHF